MKVIDLGRNQRKLKQTMFPQNYVKSSSKLRLAPSNIFAASAVAIDLTLASAARKLARIAV